jgi:hypothetical protein
MLNRIVMWMAIPVGLLSAAMFITLLLSWTRETGLCGTWMSWVLPAGYCV